MKTKIYPILVILSTLFLLAFYYPQSKQTKSTQKKDTTLVKKDSVKVDSVALKSQKNMKTIMMQQKVMDSVLMQKKAKK